MATHHGTTTLPATERVRVHRLPERGRYDRATVDAVLDAALVGHLGFASDGQTYVIPVVFGRSGDTVYVHGSAASRTLRTGAAGARMCFAVTLTDGLVLARSAFHHSVNYRSVVVLAEARPVTGDEKLAALEVITDHVVPGRWAGLRPVTDQELRATTVLALPLDESSAKVREGGVKDDPDDHGLPIWAGVIPMHTVYGDPVPVADLPDDAPAAPVLEPRR